MPPLRLPGFAARHRAQAAGARAVRVAADDAAGDGAPLPVHRLRACVAAGHQQGGRAEGALVASCAAVGVGGHRVSAPDGGPGRRSARGLVGHRQRRGAGRGLAGADRRSEPPRRRGGDRGRRTDRRGRDRPRRGRGDGPVSRRGAGRRRTGALSATRPATNTRTPWPHRRPALRHPPRAAHRLRPAHRSATPTADRRVRHRAARRSRGHLGRLPAHRRRLPQPRPSRSEDRTKKDHRDDHRGRAHGAHRADHARPNAKTSRCRRAGLLRSSRHQQRAHRGDQRPPRAPTRLRSGLS